MKNLTLLEKAKSRKTVKKYHKPVTDEEIELMMAWLKDEVGYTQISVAYGKPTVSGNVLYRMAVVLKEAYKQGKFNKSFWSK